MEKRRSANRWTPWVDVELAKSRKGPFSDYGIYQIRAVTPAGEPIPISRLAAVDPLGILYIGRSGYRRQHTRRTVAHRIGEFLRRQHSGGHTYARAVKVMRRNPAFAGHRLQARARFFSDDEIDAAEGETLREYFLTCAELPPCNSQSSNR